MSCHHSNIIQIYRITQYKDLANSTWRSYPVVPSGGVSPHTKLWPAFISNDHEMDLFLYQFGSNVSWVPNVRGASATLHLNNITANRTAGAVVVDFDRDTKEDLLQLSIDRKSIYIHQKVISFHKIKWNSHLLLSIHQLLEIPNLLPLPNPSNPEPFEYRITSFIVDDYNNDLMPDLLLGIDVYSLTENVNQTIVVKLNHDGKLNLFNHTVIDPECGKGCRFLLIDHASVEYEHSKDILIISQSSNKLGLIKNFDPTWIYMEITTTPVVSSAQYQEMETFYSGLNFHIYLLDFDQDGYLDIILPNQVSNQLEFVRNPGTQYWLKVQALKDKMSMQSKERIQSEISKSVEKWKQIKMVDSAYSINVKDFVFVNIDSEDKLVIVLLASDSIRKLFSLGRVRQNYKQYLFLLQEQKIMEKLPYVNFDGNTALPLPTTAPTTGSLIQAQLLSDLDMSGGVLQPIQAQQWKQQTPQFNVYLPDSMKAYYKDGGGTMKKTANGPSQVQVGAYNNRTETQFAIRGQPIIHRNKRPDHTAFVFMGTQVLYPGLQFQAGPIGNFPNTLVTGSGQLLSEKYTTYMLDDIRDT